MLSGVRLRTVTILLAAIFMAGAALTGYTPFAPQAAAQSPLVSVIVELSADPVVVARARAEAAGQSFDAEAYRRQVFAQQQQFLQRLTLAGVPYTLSSVTAPNGPYNANVQFRFNYVYNGITLEAPQGMLPVIASLPNVLAVHPNAEARAQLDHAVNYVRANQLYGNPPRLTGFDTLNTGGLEGDGVNVAVIDTGVDWTHEMFGADPTPPQFGVAPSIAAAGPNRKVIYYLNLTAGVTGDDFGHGTHVAGDIAGYTGYAPGRDGLPLTGDEVAVHGVAPQAKIMAYKTLSGAGTGLSASTVMAIEDAISPRTITGLPKPVAHVINMSLGSAGGPDSPSSVAADNAALAGAIVVASAGNEGPGNQAAGTGTVGAPAAGRRVIAVGANNDPGPLPSDMVRDIIFDNGRPLDLTDVLDPSSVNRNLTGAVDGTGKPTAPGQRTGIPMKLAGGSPAIGNPLAQYYVFCGTVQTAADVPDSVAGRIAIARPSGAFAAVANSIAAKGAAAIIIIRPDLAPITVINSLAPTWSMQESDVRYLLDLLSSTDTAGVDPAKGVLSEFPVRLQVGDYAPAMATFSSRGPVEGFGQVKPDVTAPGVAVQSSTVAAGGIRVGVVPAVPPGVGLSYMFNPTRFVSANGTSFSGPIVAGIAALIRQKHPDWKPSMVRAALVNAATNLRNPDGTPVADGLQTINDQGGGLVDAAAAANIKALMGVGQPGPTGQPQGRTFGILPIPSAGNPDFTPSYSFGAVPIANVIGTATLSQAVTIYDVTGGNGAGAYQLSVAPLRHVDQNGFRVSFTDPNGSPITAVTVPAGGSASFKVKTEVNGETISASPTQAQWYVIANRTDGSQRLRMPFYYRAARPAVTLAAPALAQIGDAEVSGSPLIDINGNYTLSYSFAGSPAPAQFRIEEQRDGGAFTRLADVPASQTTFAITGRGNGDYNYRVAGLFPVQYGLLQGPYSNVNGVQVNRRVEADVTAVIQTAIANVSLTAGVFEFDQTLRNTSAGQTVLPLLRFTITAIRSMSGTVRVMNADNGGNGVESAATFDYSSTLGADRALTPGETSGARRLKFSDPAAELFEFTAVVKGHFPDPAFAALSGGGGQERRRFKVRMVFIADPETGTISLAGTW